VARFSLQDVKKSIQRRNGELAVSLHFLRPGEAEAEIARCIAYHEKNLGQAQHSFSVDEARAMIGDYRLANCLLASLSHWYSWRGRGWDEVIQERGVHDLHEITSPLQLRLELYTFVNEQYQGFLPAEKRKEALTLFATRYQIQATDLEYLLALDNEDEALLCRATEQAPQPQEVATLYNQWVFEAALFNASSVHFIIDCQAFLAVQPEAESAATSIEKGYPQNEAKKAKSSVQPSNSLQAQRVYTGNPKISNGFGLGTVIKRLCYQARMLGVYYDLSYEQDVTAQGRPTRLHLTLYGPQDVTGVAQQYGQRLARLCRQLLAYNRKSNSKRAMGSAILQAEAKVHFLQRAYHFAMDARLLALLPSQSESVEKATIVQDDLYDSSVEQHIAEAFQGMARSQGVDGWQLEREPEPLLLEKSIMIPDFALTRGKKCIYVEVLGFWTPSYRERKIQKLQQLRERKDLLLIIPQEARQAFAALGTSFPIVYYDQQIGLSELLQVVRMNYDDFAERLTSINVEKVREEVGREGLMTEQECYQHLHSYRRSEVQQAAQSIINERIAFLPGLGLYDREWIEQVRRSCRQWLEEREEERLSDLLSEIRGRWASLQQCEDGILEVLFAQWQEVQIERRSIFEARVRLAGGEDREVDEGEEAEKGNLVESDEKKPLKAKHKVKKKRIEKREETTLQGNLW
jgi:predicted nuclease of restriction endonuclease-like RecB superfamily